MRAQNAMDLTFFGRHNETRNSHMRKSILGITPTNYVWAHTHMKFKKLNKKY
jgi:hypothetical protein